MKRGSRPASERAAVPSVVWQGRPRTPEGIVWAKARDRARRRALDRLRVAFPQEFEAAWDHTGLQSHTAEYDRSRMAALRVLKQAHPQEYRRAYDEELARESAAG